MQLSLITVPYDLGREDVGSGRGPGAYLQAGAAESLRARGHSVEVVTARRDQPFTDELKAVLDVNRAVAAAVGAATEAGALPLVAAGNCNVTLGVQSGLQRGGRPNAALIWLDAHGDFNTPDTTETGYLDGMALAMLCGRSHAQAVAIALGGRVLDEGAVIHVGGRDFDRGELDALLTSRITVVAGDEVLEQGPAGALGPALDTLAAARRRDAPEAAETPPVHLHVDLDVLDPSAAPGVTFPSPHGLSASQLLEVIDLVRRRFAIVALSVASFTPERDQAGTTLAAGLAVLQRVAAELEFEPAPRA